MRTLVSPEPLPHAVAEAGDTRSVVLAAHSTHLHLARSRLGKAAGVGIAPPQQTAGARAARPAWPRLNKGTRPRKEQPEGSPLISVGIRGTTCEGWGRSLWLHGENMDPGVEQVVGRSYGHANPTSWHCLLPLGTYWSHPIPHSSSQRFYEGSFRRQCPGNPSGTNSGHLQSIQACVPGSLHHKCRKMGSFEACLFWPQGKWLN